jgi:uncharacterized protein with FMN-binding domain
MTDKYKPLLILVIIALVITLLWIVPAITHRGIVTGKERIPATRHYNADGTFRTTAEAYYITVKLRSGDIVKFRVSEENFNGAKVGEKYSAK